MNRGRLARLGRVVFLPTTVPAAPVWLRSPADVLALLEVEAARVRADPTADPVARARAVGAFARVALDGIDADQVAALEAVLALIHDPGDGVYSVLGRIPDPAEDRP